MNENKRVSVILNKLKDGVTLEKVAEVYAPDNKAEYIAMVENAPTMKVNNLAALKRFFAAGGSAIQTGYWSNEKFIVPKYIFEHRKVTKLQTKSVKLGDSWLDLDKAKEWNFDAENGIAVWEDEYSKLEYLLVM